MKTFDEIFALATSPLHREYAETFTDHRLSWGVGVAQGVAVAMQETQAEIDALKAQNAELVAALQLLVTKNAIYHRLNDNHEWTLSKHQPDGIQEAIDLIAKINGNQAIAKARGDL